MKLPHRQNAYIPEEKLTEYLLSETHAIGRLKAKFFRTLGFDESNVTMLERSLLAITHTQEVKEVAASIHGKKYIIEGTLPTPGGKTVKVRTVWIIEVKQIRPRFITAYPV